MRSQRDVISMSKYMGYVKVICDENGDISSELVFEDTMKPEWSVGIMACLSSLVSNICEMLMGDEIKIAKGN